MGELLATLFLSFIFMLVVGLIKPAYALPFIKQKTRKIVLLIYGLAIICVIIAMGINGNLTQEKDNDDRQDQGISNNVNEQIETKASNINEQAETKTSNINKEAQQLGENYLKKYFIKCGNNYFTLAHTHSDFFLQHKGPLKINFESFTLDDADEANGVEFRGSVKFDLEGLGRYYSFYSMFGRNGNTCKIQPPLY